MNKTAIEWCDYSANLLKYRDKATGKVVWHCEKISSGCQNCYAAALAIRYGKGGPFNAAQTAKVTPFFDDDEAAKILRKKDLAGKRVFVDDMTDLFGEWVPDEIIDQHFAVFASRLDVTFQVLTKRPQRARDYLTTTSGKPVRENPWLPEVERAYARMAEIHQYSTSHNPKWPYLKMHDWPLPNVWLGTSVENQAAADERIPHLLKVPAAVRFLSCEPLLGPVNLRSGIYLTLDKKDYGTTLQGISWVIVGGESGPGARPMNLEWARSIVGQCKAAGVTCFVKQLGSRPDWNEPHLKLIDRKGGNPSEWPEDLRVREFPEADPCV